MKNSQKTPLSLNKLIELPSLTLNQESQLEEKLKKCREWKVLHGNYKSYSSGTPQVQIQQEFSIDMQTTSNNNLPLPNDAPRLFLVCAHPPFPQEAHSPNNNPNLYHHPVWRGENRKARLNSLFNLTWQRPLNALCKEQTGARIQDWFAYHLISFKQREEAKQTPFWPRYRGPPSEIAEQAMKNYPQLPDSFSQQIVYMHKDLDYTIEQIALFYPTSPEQVRKYYALCNAALSYPEKNNYSMKTLKASIRASSLPDQYTPEKMRDLEKKLKAKA